MAVLNTQLLSKTKRYPEALRNIDVALMIVLTIMLTQVTLFVSPAVGVYLNAFCMLVLVFTFFLRKENEQLAIAAIILPLVNLVGISLPQRTSLLQTSLFYGVLLVFSITYSYLFRLDFPHKASRLSKENILLPISALVGVVLGGGSYSLIGHRYPFSNTSIVLMAVISIISAMIETMFFQGLIQRQAMKLMHPFAAATLALVLYTGMSFGHDGGILAPILALLTGTSMAALYAYKQSLVPVMALNIMTKLTFLSLVTHYLVR